MSQQSIMLRNHAVMVEPFGGSAVVKVDSAGGTVYYADNRSVSSSSNQGSIAPGGTATFTSNTYITSAGVTTSVLVTTTSVYDEWAALNPLNLGGGSVVTVQGASGTNLGAAQTLDFQSKAQEIWLVGTANANLTVTVANRVAGCKSLIILTQDGTGSRTLTVTDGVSPQSVPVTTTPGAASVVEVSCPDPSAVNVAISGGTPGGDASGTIASMVVNTVQGGRTPMAQQVDALSWVADAGNPIFPTAVGATGVGGGFGDIWYDGTTFHYYGMVDGTTPGIYHWTSSTGRAGSWTADAGNPILLPGTTGLWDAGSVGVPCVWSEGTNLFMIYRGIDGSGNVKLGKATAATSNPSVWTKSGSNPVFSGTSPMTSSEAGPGRIIKLTSAVGGFAAGTYIMWISNISGYNRWCSYATAPDLGSNNGPGTWTQAAVNPVFSGGRFCNSVWTDGSFYYSLVPHYTGFAASAEIELWRSTLPTFPHNNRDYLGVVRRINTSNAWEASQYDTPTVLCDTIQRNSQNCTGGQPWIYYSGQSAPGLFLEGLLLPQVSHSPAPLDRKGIVFCGPWTQDAVAASQTAVQIPLSGQANHLYFRNPFSCSVVAVTVTTSANVTAGTLTAKLTNWLGNAAYTFFPAGGLAVNLTSGKSQAGVAAEEGDYFFAAGEGFGIQLTTTGTYTPLTLNVDVTVAVLPR